MLKPNYNNSIMSITNSLLRHYGAKPHHLTLTTADDLLAKKYKNVVFLVLDGMGMNVLESSLSPDAFLRKHIKAEISSVFPPTTTAATTSILTGKTPAEHGWLGWSCYFKEVDKCIDLFSNHESGTNIPASEEHQPFKHMSFDNILTTLGDRVRTCAVSNLPFTKKYFADTMEGICGHIRNLCDEDGEKFIYAYYFQPDRDLHGFGIGSERVVETMLDCDTQLGRLMSEVSDTLLLITADHGMINSTAKCVEDYPQINDALVRHICVEPRCCSMYVKDEYISMFPKLFRESFGDKFLLLTHDEFLESGLLGDGVKHPRVQDFIGDYVAIAVSDTALWYRDVNGGHYDFRAFHAGLTKEELAVPFIVVEK